MNVFDELVGGILAATDTSSPWAVGTITAVAVGTAADGNALVTVNWQGASPTVPYLSQYTPVVGHVVLMARFGPQLVVLGRLVGTPPSS